MIDKILIRVRDILKNNLLLVPNLLRGTNATRLYILKIWFLNNVDYINLTKNGFQKIILKNRVRGMHPTSKSEFLNSENLDKRTLDNLDVIYINLKHRTDRRNELLQEFEKIDLINFNRFNATKNDDGLLGCVLSHKKVLENWVSDESRLLMVCEDDLTITGTHEELKSILFEFNNDQNLDVLCLSHNHFNEYLYNERFSLTSDTQTTACYVIKPYMQEVMIKNFNLSIKLLEAGIDRQYKIALDQVWKVLQKKYRFVIPNKRFAHQRESFSDIEKRVVDYKV